MVVPLIIPNMDPFTNHELITFCIANPDLCIEQNHNGRLFIKMAGINALMSSNKSELIGEIGIWNRLSKTGKVLESKTGYFLADSSMRVCDVAWIRLDRWNSLSMAEKKSFPHLAPDFIIELKSESDRLSDLKAKMFKWIENGVRLAWLVSTENQITYIFEPGKPETTCLFTDLLSGEDVLPDFSVRLSDILEY